MGIDDFSNASDSRRDDVPKIPLSRLEEARRDFEQITDALGFPIDAGIREAVAVLNAIGANTSGSCEGHLDRGSPVPYIDIEAPGKPSIIFEGEEQKLQELAQKHSLDADEILSWPLDEERASRAKHAYVERFDWIRETSPEYTTSYQKWNETDDRYRSALTRLLNEFYTTHTPPPIGRLTVDHDRLRPESVLYDRYIAESREGRPTDWSQNDAEELARLLPAHQAEMNAFIDFLKDKFIEPAPRDDERRLKQ